MADKKTAKKEQGIEVKVGQKYELSPNQDMWKDDLSGVFLRAPGKKIMSRPKGTDYRSQMEWFNRNRFNKPRDIMYVEDEGNSWFEITDNMNTNRIKVAISKGILLPKGKAIKVKKKETKKLFTTDNITGEIIYNGPNKNIWKLLQRNNVSNLVKTIESIQDPGYLEILLEMEQKGWNPASASRYRVTEAIEKQIKENSIGLTPITESDPEKIKDKE